MQKKYNYKPNYFASNLKKRENLILGVILPDFKNEYYLNLLCGITEESSKSKHRIMVYHSYNDYNKEKAYIKLLLGSIIDGLIFSPIALKKGLVNLSKSTKDNYPTIIINNNNSIWSKFTKAKLNGYDDGKNSVKILVEKIKNQKLNLYAS